MSLRSLPRDSPIARPRLFRRSMYSDGRPWTPSDWNNLYVVLTQAMRALSEDSCLFIPDKDSIAHREGKESRALSRLVQWSVSKLLLRCNALLRFVSRYLGSR